MDIGALSAFSHHIMCLISHSPPWMVFASRSRSPKRLMLPGQKLGEVEVSTSIYFNRFVFSSKFIGKEWDGKSKESEMFPYLKQIRINFLFDLNCVVGVSKLSYIGYYSSLPFIQYLIRIEVYYIKSTLKQSFLRYSVK